MFANTPFLRQLATLLSGTAAGQLIALAAAPLLTRLYGPADFAVVAAFVGVATILSIFCTLRYELSLLLPKEDEEADTLLRLSFLLLIISTIGMTVLLWLFGDLLTQTVPTFAAISAVMPLVPPMMFAIGAFQILNAWANRRRDYREMALSGVLHQGGSALIAVGLGWLKSPGNGLLTGRLIGVFVGVAWLALRMRVNISLTGWNATAMRVAAWRYRQFPVFNVPYSVLGVVSQEFLVFALLAYQFGEAAGHFALVRTIMLLPARHLSTSLGLVFFREAATLFGTPKLEYLTLSIMYRLGMLTLPLLVFFVFWSQEIFTVVFGSQWEMAGKIAAYYAPVGFLFLFTSWPERLYEISQKQQVSLAIEIGGNILKLAVVLGILSANLGPMAAIAGYAIADALYHLTYLLGLFRVGGFNISRLGLLCTRLFVLAIPCATACLVIRQFPVSLPWQAAISLALLCGLSYGSIRCFKWPVKQ